MKTGFFILCILFIFTQNLISQNLIEPPIIESLQSPPDSVFDFNNSNVIHRMNNDFIIGWNHGAEGRQLSTSFPVINKDYQEGGRIVTNMKYL